MYDGISGLVTQPLEGAKKEGFVGLIKGFGKGIGGVVLKPNAGESFPRFLVASCLRHGARDHVSTRLGRAFLIAGQR